MNSEQEIALLWIGRQIWLHEHRQQEPTRLPQAFCYLKAMDQPFPPATPGVDFGPLTSDEREGINERIAIMLEANPSMDEEAATVCALCPPSRDRKWTLIPPDNLSGSRS